MTLNAKGDPVTVDEAKAQQRIDKDTELMLKDPIGWRLEDRRETERGCLAEARCMSLGDEHPSADGDAYFFDLCMKDAQRNENSDR